VYRELEALYDATILEDIQPNYNAAPTHQMPVYSNEGLVTMRWGLIPAWSKDEKLGYKLFNTRSETVFEKPIWKGIIKRNRCLIPANGFYEWKKTDEGKIPYYIHFPNEKLFSFAGIWETWKHDNKTWLTFSIMTTTPNKEMEPIHDRMPVIIDHADYDMWLNAANAEDIRALLQPLADESLEMHEVSSEVNIVKSNSKELITPLNSK
jgi:putative SOS response-associated peptidase YedK